MLRLIRSPHRVWRVPRGHTPFRPAARADRRPGRLVARSLTTSPTIDHALVIAASAEALTLTTSPSRSCVTKSVAAVDGHRDGPEGLARDGECQDVDAALAEAAVRSPVGRPRRHRSHQGRYALGLVDETVLELDALSPGPARLGASSGSTRSARVATVASRRGTSPMLKASGPGNTTTLACPLTDVVETDFDLDRARLQRPGILGHQRPAAPRGRRGHHEAQRDCNDADGCPHDRSSPPGRRA